MIKLIKGDINNLEGRVTAFSKLDDEAVSELMHFPKIIALYGSTNPLDLFEKVGMPPGEVKDVEKHVKETISEISKKFNDKIKESEVEVKLLNIYATPILIENEADLYTGKGDVIDAGNYYNVISSFDAIKKGIDFYFMKFEDSLKKKHNIQNQEKGAEGKKVQLNYKDIEKGLLKNYILNNFVTPILDSKRYGEEKDAKSIRLNFFKFCEGSPFITDALKVTELIEAKYKDLDLINDYLDKIEAINKEDYMAAAKIRDKISGKK